MVFPASYFSVLMAALAGLLLGALWLLPQRSTGKWRFELFGLDFSVGVLLASIVTGLTIGSLGSDITFYDNLNIIRKSSLLFLFGIGALLNLGTLLLLAAIAVSGAATGFLMGFTFSVAVTAIGVQMVWPMTSALFTGIGVAVLLLAVALAARAHGERVRHRETELIQKVIAAGMKGKVAKTPPIKGIALALAAGLCIGVVLPMAMWTQSRDEIAFGAYSIGTMFAASFVIAGPFFALFFLNLPVQGEALSFGAWMRGSARQHLMGLAGGALWYCAWLAILMTASANPASGVGRGLGFSISHLSMLVAGLLGLSVWDEYSGAASARSAALLSVGLAAVGTLIFAFAPAL